MKVKIIRLVDLALYFQLEKAQREVKKREAQVERLRIQKNNATEALHNALARVLQLKAEEAKQS